MNIIMEKPWSYVLFNYKEGDWIITLLTGGAMEVDISVRLTPEEVFSIKNNPDRVDEIVEEIKKNRGKFSAREIKPPVWP